MSLRRRTAVACALLCAVLVSGCGGSSSSTAPGAHASTPPAGGGGPDAVTVTSDAFEDGGRIPARFTCDGDQTSPPLAWTGGGKPAAWALVVDDPDAPGGTFVHWVVLDLPSGTRSLAPGEDPDATVLTNSAGSASYAGPCPPSGTHHYRFIVYALPAPTGLTGEASLDDALAEVRSSARAQGTLIGLYARGS